MRSRLAGLYRRPGVVEELLAKPALERTVANEIVLESINPYDLTPEELNTLAQDIRDSVPGVSVAVGFEEEEGSGVTWVQAIHMFLPDAEFWKDAAYSQICAAVFKFYKKRRTEEHQTNRVHNLVVHDEEGNTLEILSLKPGEDEPQVLPPDDDFKRPKPSKRLEKPSIEPNDQMG
jgi:hypothetical protein